LCCAFFLYFLFSSQSEESNHNLVVGLQSGYPPFEFIDEQGKLVGFDIELAHHIAKKLNRNLEIKDMDFDAEILSLKQGKIDLIISGMNITPSRTKEILMVPYLGDSADSFTLIFWGEIPEGIQTLKDLNKLPNAIVSVQSGAVTESYLAKIPGIHSRSFEGALAPLMDVKYGKSTANLVENDTAEYLKRKHPEIKTLLIPVPPEEQIGGFGIGIHKQNPELYEQIQLVIQEFKTSGFIQHLKDKWFKGGEHAD
jgi:arginine transport system substrate-binding protein